jgi:uncharacterized protein YabN with tetrapyrrole methylase and pyrophosphatase domain
MVSKRRNKKLGVGTLIIVGTGMKGLAQMTPESLQWLRRADVAFCVVPPRTREMLEIARADIVDLNALRSPTKARIHTYRQMRDAILVPLRDGKTVCAIFYGHPGVAVLPSHEAIEIARGEGHRTQMLPGVSALDCLLADLGVDPFAGGCQLFEATGMLCRPEKPATDLHTVIYQINSVGDLGSATAKGFSGNRIDVLIEFLKDAFDSRQKCYLYRGAMSIGEAPVIKITTIGKLTVKRCRDFSTMYIVPKKEKPNAKMVKKLNWSN